MEAGVLPKMEAGVLPKMEARGTRKCRHGQGECSLSCQWALTQKQTLGRWFECPSILLERLQRGVALEALGKRGSSFRTEIVEFETANEGMEAGF